MGCTRNRLKIWDNWAQIIVLFVCLILPSAASARFASQFSLLVGEQFTDNIFFSKDKENDFITVITPSLTLLYAPEGQLAPTLNINLSPSGRLYSRHSELNGFGDSMAATAGYTYQYSPRLNFNFSDTLQRQGETRTGGLDGFGQFLTGPTSSPPVGGVTSPPLSQNLKDLVSGGDLLTNSFSFRGSFLYRPDINIDGGYTNTFTKFLDLGGTDVFHTVGVRGIYNWQRDHNLHAGYSLSISSSRNGDSGVIHNFDIGDDYFTNYTLQLTPTLSLAATTGVSFNIGSHGPRIANNTSVTVTKIWETAALNAGMRKGLTPSFGVSGISDTMSFFANFNHRLTEKLTTTANAIFSLYDTDDVNFKTFQSTVGLRYLFTTWLYAGIDYYFNWRRSGAGANSTDLLEKGTVTSNNVLLSLTMRFDIWPNTGLARNLSASSLTPVITPPFPGSTLPQPTAPFPAKAP